MRRRSPRGRGGRRSPCERRPPQKVRVARRVARSSSKSRRCCGQNWGWSESRCFVRRSLPPRRRRRRRSCRRRREVCKEPGPRRSRARCCCCCCCCCSRERGHLHRHRPSRGRQRRLRGGEAGSCRRGGERERRPRRARRPNAAAASSPCASSSSARGPRGAQRWSHHGRSCCEQASADSSGGGRGFRAGADARPKATEGERLRGRRWRRRRAACRRRQSAAHLAPVAAAAFAAPPAPFIVVRTGRR